MQRYPLISSMHVAPKAQGEDWHSLISAGREGKKPLRGATETAVELAQDFYNTETLRQATLAESPTARSHTAVMNLWSCLYVPGWFTPVPISPQPFLSQFYYPELYYMEVPLLSLGP